jgi:hypothetical protein
LREDVRRLLQRVRQDVNELWTQVGKHNEFHPTPEGEKELVTFYFGQNVEEAESYEREQG